MQEIRSSAYSYGGTVDVMQGINVSFSMWSSARAKLVYVIGYELMVLYRRASDKMKVDRPKA